MNDVTPRQDDRPFIPDLWLSRALGRCQRCRASNGGARLLGLRWAGTAGWTRVVLCRACVAEAEADPRFEVGCQVIDGGLS